MKRTLDKKLFFSMTLDFLDVYIPQDSPSIKTVKTYRDGLTVFRRYVCDEKHLSISSFRFEDCTFDLVLDYRNWLLDEKKRARSTVNNRLAAIKSYVRYASARDVTLQQVFLSISEVPFLSVEKRIRPVIEDTEALKAFLDSPPNTRTGCRDTMILSVLFDTMIRADELIRISMGDICLNAGIPYILIHGKGNKERTVSISEKVVPLIRAYMKEFHGSPAEDTDFPFIYTVSHGAVHRMSERNLVPAFRTRSIHTCCAGRAEQGCTATGSRSRRSPWQWGTPISRRPGIIMHSHHWNRSGQQWKKEQVSSHRETRSLNGRTMKTN